jgi:hypothetical protein
VDRLSWISDLNDNCVETSSYLKNDNVYLDIQEVIEGLHSAIKLSKYIQIMKEFPSNGKCELNDYDYCLDSYLYVARSFLARGHERDIDDALNILEIYGKKKSSNLYSDTIFLAITIFNGKKQGAQKQYYKSAIENTKKFMESADYFSIPHSQRLCGLLLDHISAAYANMGDYASDLYITTTIQD